MPDEQLSFDGPPVPLDQLGPREVRTGERGGAAVAAAIPDRWESYLDVLRLFNRHSHADFEVADALPDVNRGTLCKRRLRLERAGLLQQVPGVTRETPDGVDAMVFAITPQGKETFRTWAAKAQEQSSGPPHPLMGEEPTPISSMPSGPIPGSGRSFDVV